jgi:O-antigen/teichoic acid export membrane protein
MLFDDIKDAFKHSLVYGGGAVLRNAIALLLIPLYGAYLTKPEYGAFQVLEATARFLLVALDMGIGSAYILAIMYEDVTDRRTATTTAFSFLLVTSLIVGSVLAVFCRLFSVILLGDPAYRALLLTVLAMVVFQLTRTVPLARLRAGKQSRQDSFLVALSAALQLVFCFGALAGIRKGLAGAVAANAVSAGVMVIVYIVVIRTDVVSRFSPACLKSMLKFGLPLVPAELAATALTFSDRYFLRHFRTLDELGLYGMGYNIGMVMGLAMAAVQLAWPPIVLAASKRDDARQFYALFLTCFVFGSCFLAVGLILFSPDIVHLILPGWSGAIPIVPWIVASYVLWGVQIVIATVGVSLKKKSQQFAAAMIAAAGLNLLLNWILIPTYGATGAAAATLISYAAMAVGGAAVSLWLYPVKYEYGRLLKIVVVAIALCLVALPLARLENALLAVGIKAVCLLMFPVALYILRFYTAEELEYARHAVVAFVPSLRPRR